MKEISRKCLIFPGSSPLIKSWKKSLLEVSNRVRLRLLGEGGRGGVRENDVGDRSHRRNLVFVVLREFNDNGHTRESVFLFRFVSA